jgi:uncharacterized protein YhhL (DUF1145 family)
MTATATTPTGTPPGVNPAVTAAPISLPLRAVLPGWREGIGLVALCAASLAVSAKRPAGIPPKVQRAADVSSAVVLLVHPLEVALLRRQLRKRHNVTAGTRRKMSIACAVLGVGSTRHALPRLKALSAAR